MRWDYTKTIKLLVAIVASQLAGIIGFFFTITSVNSWYATLVKPSFNPPSWLFGPVWITLYTLMGISLFIIWELKAYKEMKIFFVQLFLNALWTILFFGVQNPLFALIEIILLWFAIIVTIVVFYRKSKVAAYLLIPYLLWVTFAAVLNGAIVVLN